MARKPGSIFPQALIQVRRHLFTSLRRACLRAAMLSVYGHMRAPSHHPTFLSNCAARFLTKVVCASCIVPGCCAQVALCKLLHAAARKCSVQVALRKCSEQVALSKLLCASALRQLLRASALRMCSVQVALRKCSEQVALRKCSAPVAPCKRFAHVLCASWSVQVALRKCFVQLLCASKLLCASCSAQVALCKWLCASCSAQVLPELWECTSRTFFVFKSCGFPAGAAGVCSTYYVCLRFSSLSCGSTLRILRLYLKVPELQEYGPRTTLRFSSRSCGGVLRVLRLYLKVAIFQPELREHAPHTTSVLKSCDFPAGAAGARSAYYVCT